MLGLTFDWTPEIEGISAVVVLTIVGLLHSRIERKVNRGNEKIDSIDKAVNSRPSDQPKLYDIAQTADMKIDAAVKIAEETRREARESLAAIGRKIDRGFDTVNYRFDGIDRRCNSIDNRVDAIDRRADVNATAIDRLENIKQDRFGPRAGLPDPDPV
jgi:chromosome segregation ATPase